MIYQRVTRIKNVAIVNRQARHNYDLLTSQEAGLILRGWEVKSLKKGAANIVDSYLRFKAGELWLKNLSIQPLITAYPSNISLKRDIKVLLHKKELTNLYKAVNAKRLSIIPTKIFTSKNLLKVKITLAKGKKKYDKRKALKLKTIKRDKERCLET